VKFKKQNLDMKSNVKLMGWEW